MKLKQLIEWDDQQREMRCYKIGLSDSVIRPAKWMPVLVIPDEEVC